MSRRVILTLLIMGLLGGCVMHEPGTPAPRPESSSAPSSTTGAAPPVVNVIVLDVTGSATISSLTLVVDGNSSEENSVALPWHRTFEFPEASGSHEWKLVLRYGGGSVHATCTANGQLLTQTSGSGSAGSTSSAELSGSITG